MSLSKPANPKRPVVAAVADFYSNEDIGLSDNERCPLASVVQTERSCRASMKRRQEETLESDTPSILDPGDSSAPSSPAPITPTTDSSFLGSKDAVSQQYSKVSKAESKRSRTGVSYSAPSGIHLVSAANAAPTAGTDRKYQQDEERPIKPEMPLTASTLDSLSRETSRSRSRSRSPGIPFFSTPTPRALAPKPPPSFAALKGIRSSSTRMSRKSKTTRLRLSSTKQPPIKTPDLLASPTKPSKPSPGLVDHSKGTLRQRLKSLARGRWHHTATETSTSTGASTSKTKAAPMAISPRQGDYTPPRSPASRAPTTPKTKVVSSQDAIAARRMSGRMTRWRVMSPDGNDSSPEDALAVDFTTPAGEVNAADKGKYTITLTTELEISIPAAEVHTSAPLTSPGRVDSSAGEDRPSIAGGTEDDPTAHVAQHSSLSTQSSLPMGTACTSTPATEAPPQKRLRLRYYPTVRDHVDNASASSPPLADPPAIAPQQPILHPGCPPLYRPAVVHHTANVLPPNIPLFPPFAMSMNGPPCFSPPSTSPASSRQFGHPGMSQDAAGPATISVLSRFGHPPQRKPAQPPISSQLPLLPPSTRPKYSISPGPAFDTTQIFHSKVFGFIDKLVTKLAVWRVKLRSAVFQGLGSTFNLSQYTPGSIMVDFIVLPVGREATPEACSAFSGRGFETQAYADIPVVTTDWITACLTDKRLYLPMPSLASATPAFLAHWKLPNDDQKLKPMSSTTDTDMFEVPSEPVPKPRLRLIAPPSPEVPPKQRLRLIAPPMPDVTRGRNDSSESEDDSPLQIDKEL